MNRMPTVAILAVALTALVIGGCGYSVKSDFRPDIRTIAVPIWRRGTQEYRRDIEIRFTSALVRHIESTTPYKVVDESRADSVLTGTIQSANQQVLSYDPRTGRPQAIQLRLAADFVWKDLRTGEKLTEQKNFRVATTYVPEAPMSEDFFLGSEGAVNILAQRVVEQLKQPW